MKKVVGVIVHYAPITDEVEVEVDEGATAEEIQRAVENERMLGRFDRSGVRIATKVEVYNG